MSGGSTTGAAHGGPPALANGHVRVFLEGEKLRGGYALTQTSMRGDPANWLLVKVDDEGADARRNPVRIEPDSVLTGRTVEDADEEADEEA